MKRCVNFEITCEADQTELDEVFINGSMEHRLPNNLNISFAYVEGEAIILAIKRVLVHLVLLAPVPVSSRVTFFERLVLMWS